ncbi:Gfo/Idh/MocA family protein [Oceanibacterium hippocampi]|uniref:Putative 4,5-dihydroxyphthalate dehydrogenase n=1 Tax=Oceanibacterium hippocampi TaxID=745714 RepID=A0A1Y5TWZ8_9PROT|nr:Gfo/Idh/MocA family oxidoreductase [Oceanibacterium hippocampi]SLN75757.1 Putative 4,5-dihydroxyphthalate dehydrogenase [Oceanibacterium hippocampi]
MSSTSDGPRGSGAGPVGIGVAGLGRAFMLTLPSLLKDARFRLAGGFDPREEAMRAFTDAFGGGGHDSLDAMLADPAVEVVYVASPHELHADQACAALEAGKQVLLEKPIAESLEASRRIVATACRTGGRVIVGPAHSFDAPVLACLDLIRSGRFGKVRLVQMTTYTDFMHRPRRPEELDSARGGGVVFSQGAHQVDIVRLLAGGLTQAVSANAGNWDPERPGETAYSALLRFRGGASASLTYSGHGHYNSNELHDWIDELGWPRAPEQAFGARHRLRQGLASTDELALKNARTFGFAPIPDAAPENEHFGQVIVSLDGADIAVTPRGLTIYDDERLTTMPLPLPEGAGPRWPVLDAVWNMARGGPPAIQDAAWGHATLAVCVGIPEAAATDRWLPLADQVAVPDHPNLDQPETET